MEPGDRVAVLAGNTHVTLAAHYAVPFAGGVLVALNTRITPADIAYIVGHAGATVLVYDHEYAAAAAQVADTVGAQLRLVRAGGDADQMEPMIAVAAAHCHPVADERSLLALNYTSGTTARPKGVMYHHRGAYLQALAMAMHMGLSSDSVYLWTLPMFHCNGWCFPWAVTAMGGVHLCLPRVDPAEIWRHMRESGVSHFCAAPTVLTMTIWHPDAGKAPRRVRIATGGAPPTPAFRAPRELDMDITHLYGLTETFGPVALCEWRSEWNALPIAEQANLKARQGVEMRSANASGWSTRACRRPADGTTMGESRSAATT